MTQTRRYNRRYLNFRAIKIHRNFKTGFLLSYYGRSKRSIDLDGDNVCGGGLNGVGGSSLIL
jgi:hypothetical protein